MPTIFPLLKCICWHKAVSLNRNRIVSSKNSWVSDSKEYIPECGFYDIFDILTYCASKWWLAVNSVSCFEVFA